MTTSMPPLHVTGVQIANVDAKTKDDVRKNVQHACEFIENHQKQQIESKSYSADGSITTPTKLYLLPELSSCGYPMDSKFDDLPAVSESIDGSVSIQSFGSLSKKLGVFICFGFILREEERYHIAQGVTNPQGELQALYRKTHLCSFGACSEQSYFSAPRPIDSSLPFDEEFSRLLPVFECEGYRVGIAICYDVRFPEIFRLLAFRGRCDVVLHPSAFPRDGLSWNWTHCVISRALENQIYVLTMNRAGEDFGASIFSPPWIEPEGSPLRRTIESPTRDECTLDIEVRRDVIDNVRESVTFRKDRFFQLDEWLWGQNDQ